MATIEQSPHSNNQPIPSFPECFRQAQRSFTEAIRLWGKTRLIHLLPGENRTITEERDEVIKDLQDASTTFDERIFSPYFEPLLPYLRNSAGIVCWSEGNPEVQVKKVAAARQKIEQEGGNQFGRVYDLVGPDKMALIGDIFMIALSITDMIPSLDLKNLPVVVLEDKASNIIKFMAEYIARGERERKLPLEFKSFSEENLDNPAFNFDKILNQWHYLIERYPKHFQHFRFLYFPPVKPVGAGEIIGMTTLRQDRVKTWLEISNSEVKTKLDSEDKFHHIDSIPDIAKIFEGTPLVVADVDGPLVGQQKVLETREEKLREILVGNLEPMYQKLFGISISEFASFLLDPNEKQKEIQNRLIMKSPLGNEFKCDVTGKQITSGVRVHIFHHLNNDYTIIFDTQKFKEAVESLGISLGE